MKPRLSTVALAVLLQAGLALAQAQQSSESTQAAQASGAKVLIVGMQVPPNYGQDYTKRFSDSFATVAKANKAALVPFLLKGVADVPNAAKLFQADRIHPNESAQATMRDNVWPELRKLLAPR